MKFKVFLKSQNRYLTDEELHGKYYAVDFNEADPDNYENIERFEVNLLTGKIQTESDIALCTDPDCCGGPDLVMVDNDDFIIEIDNTVTNSTYFEDFNRNPDD